MRDYSQIVRYKTDNEIGLTAGQLRERKKAGLVNKTKIIVGKTYFQIIMSNLFSLFNILLYIIAALMIVCKYYDGLFFLIILALNTGIGLYQDIKARVLMGRLRVVTAPKATVIRGGVKSEIPTHQLVLDDLVILKTNSQISADSVVLFGSCSVNESLLTGESRNVNKKVGDILYSGTYITSGEVYARVDKVGADSYIETIQSQAKKFKRSPSEILRTLHKLFILVGIIVISIAGVSIGLYASRGAFDSFESFQVIVGPLSGSLVSMIPAGLYLLTSTALAVGVISLAKKKAHVQEFYSIEMLSRTNVLCVDKTGTITDGTMKVKKIVPFTGYTGKEMVKMIIDLIYATNDDNFTSQALKNCFKIPSGRLPVEILPFSSENKYSAASFRDETYVIGAAEFMPLKNKAGVIQLTQSYAEKGYRVLVLAKTKEKINDYKINSIIEPVGMVILQDHIKEDAPETFKWFNDNGVEVKVISGDNAATVAETARQAGINGADKYISLEKLSLEQVYDIADKYTIFGRVSPEQKETIIRSLKDKKKTVAMTGDGVNDILALKRADCSIAMASGADAARNVSHIVLLDSNFARLPDVVSEGRRVVNNVQRTSSLFLVKTIFAMVLSITFLVISMCGHPDLKYPFSTNNMYVWEFVSIGIASFFLALQRNNEPIKGKFGHNIAKKAFAGAAVMIVAVGLVYLGAYLQQAGIMYTGINGYGFSYGPKGIVSDATAMSVICFTGLSLVILFDICYPLDKYRRAVFIGAVVLVLGLLTMFGLFQTSTDFGIKNLLKIDFASLSGANILYVCVVIVGLSAIYLFIKYLVLVITGNKGNKNNVEAK